MNYLDKINLAAENREMMKNSAAIAEAKALEQAKEKVKGLADEAIEIIEIVQGAIDKGFIPENEWYYLCSKVSIFQYKPQSGPCKDYYPIRVNVEQTDKGPKTTSIRGMDVGIGKSGKLVRSRQKSDNWECFYNEFGAFKKQVYEYIDKKISPFLG